MVVWRAVDVYNNLDMRPFLDLVSTYNAAGVEEPEVIVPTFRYRTRISNYLREVVLSKILRSFSLFEAYAPLEVEG
jgi:hypothetical protein